MLEEKGCFCLINVRIFVMAFLLVVVSGCPGPSPGASDGIRISSFGFDSPTISDKDQAELSIALENAGAFDSTDVNFFIYGYDANVWESVSTDASMGSASADSWTIDNFDGYVMDTGQPGFSADYTQILKVIEGKIAKGITQSFGFNGRLCYDYETKAIAKVKAISLSQRRDEKSKGTFSDGGILVKNSFAPIQIDVMTKSPIVFYDANGGQETEVVLIIKNAAGGYPAATGCSQDVTVADVNKLSGLDVTLDGEALACDQTYSFYDGQAIVYCTYNVGSSRPKGEYTLSVTAKYYYYNDAKASISVVGSSSDVVVTPGDGGGGGGLVKGAVLKWGSCEDLCKAAGIKPADNLNSLAVCNDGSDTVLYPGTNQQALLCDWPRLGATPDPIIKHCPDLLAGLVPKDLSSTETYLSDLKVHDVTVNDIKLLQLGMTTLNQPGISKQYPEKAFFVDDDGDGLPNSWEDLFSGCNGKISSTRKNGDGIGKDDGGEICTCCGSGTGCVATQTFSWNYKNGCKRTEYYGKLSLGLSNSLSLNDAWVTSTANPTLHQITGDENVAGMKIYKIGSVTIADETAKHLASGVKSIKYIDVGMLNINNIDKVGADIPNLFKKTNCAAGTSTKDTMCRCAYAIEGVKGGSYLPLEGTNNVDCNDKCSNLGKEHPETKIKGGRCLDAVQKGSYRCSGSTLVHYGMSDPSINCASGLLCLCYAEDRVLTTNEKKIMCK